MSKTDVVIIGAGMAGLACARRLSGSGVSFALLEASDAVGGRVRTDQHEGFLLDRGFQVLYTGSTEVRALLDLEALQLGAFDQDVLLRLRSGFQAVEAPWGEGSALRTLFTPIGGLGDRFRLMSLGSWARSGPEAIWGAEETSALELLRRRGFSQASIDTLLAPWFGTLLNDPQLSVSGRYLGWRLSQLAAGEAALPARGMQAIPEQLAATLPEGCLRLGARVSAVREGEVQLESGETLQAGAVVVAAESAEAARLLPGLPARGCRGNTCLYYAAPEPPYTSRSLSLASGHRGVISSVAVLSNVQPAYAPPGQALIAVMALGVPHREVAMVDRLMRSQLLRWYGDVVNSWRLLRGYLIPNATPLVMNMGEPPAALHSPGIYVCGDYRNLPCMHGALESGRWAAESILQPETAAADAAAGAV